MDQVLTYIQQNIAMAPFVIFFLFCLAGVNVPISEDGLIFAAAVLASKNPEHSIPIFSSVIVGAYVSDIFAYWVGRLLGPKLFEIKFFSKMVTRERFDKVSRFYARFGITTLIIGRFIPFGVRNALYMTAGIGRMRMPIFLVANIIAVSMTCSTYFYLYYRYGEDVIKQVQRFGVTAFLLAVFALLIYLWRKYRTP